LTRIFVGLVKNKFESFSAMPRPRTFDSDAVIDKLCEYFWEHEYSAVSLDDLAQQLGIKRGSLFNAFGSKEALLYAAFQRYGQIFQKNYETTHHGREAIVEYFNNAIALATTQGVGRGCFLVNLLMFQDIPTPELQQALDQDVAFIKEFFANHLHQAQQEQDLLPAVSISAGVDALFGAMVGLFALARMRATPVAVEEFVHNNLRGLFAEY
jgi:TetR/AcrR family transcriptional regulator, transcriptional repressor for nem operon